MQTLGYGEQVGDALLVETLYAEALPGPHGSHSIQQWERILPKILGRLGIPRISAREAEELMFHPTLKINPHRNTMIWTIQRLLDTGIAVFDAYNGEIVDFEKNLTNLKSSSWTNWIGSMVASAVRVSIVTPVKWIFKEQLSADRFVVFPKIIESQANKIKKHLFKDYEETVRSELIFPYERVYKAFLETREAALVERDNDILEAEFASIVSYSSKIVSFKVCESRFLKFINDSSKLLDSSDFAIAAIKMGIETCIRMYKLASKSTSKQRIQQQREYLLKLRNCKFLLGKIDDLEFNHRLHKINLDSLNALKDGVPDYDEVARTIDDLAEAISNADEIDRALTEDIGVNSSTLIDDDSIENEFNMLMEQMHLENAKEDMKIAEAVSQLPSITPKPRIISTEAIESKSDEIEENILFE